LIFWPRFTSQKGGADQLSKVIAPADPQIQKGLRAELLSKVIASLANEMQ
jgi:hypothetical protein